MNTKLRNCMHDKSRLALAACLLIDRLIMCDDWGIALDILFVLPGSLSLVSLDEPKSQKSFMACNGIV